MITSTAHVPTLLALGVVSATLYRRLRTRSENWYLFLTVLSVGALWALVAAVNLGLLAQVPGVTGTVSMRPAIGVPYVLAYPLWFRAAGELTFVLRGRQTDQGGLLWVFRLSDDTDRIEPSWGANDAVEDERSE